MQESTGLLVGDVLLSAACIAYYGAFPGKYRQELVSGWVDKCKEYGIPVSPDCTLRGTLASPIQVYHLCCASLCVCLYMFLSVYTFCDHEVVPDQASPCGCISLRKLSWQSLGPSMCNARGVAHHCLHNSFR